MIISTTEKNAWTELRSVDKKGIELTVIGEKQTVRGFGTCFSELGALALMKLSEKERCEFLDELFPY